MTILAYTKDKNLHFAELLMSLGEYYQYIWDNTSQKKAEKIHRIESLPSFTLGYG